MYDVLRIEHDTDNSALWAADLGELHRICDRWEPMINVIDIVRKSLLH